MIASLKTLINRLKKNINRSDQGMFEPFSKAILETTKPSNVAYGKLIATKSESKGLVEPSR